MTKKDAFPAPDIERCLSSFRRDDYFSIVDANNGYLQFEVRKSDRDKTLFVTDRGLYRFIRMPFGLCTAPATYQRATAKVFGKFVELKISLSKAYEISISNLNFQ